MASQLIGTTETGWFNPGVNPPPFDMKLLLMMAGSRSEDCGRTFEPYTVVMTAYVQQQGPGDEYDDETAFDEYMAGDKTDFLDFQFDMKDENGEVLDWYSDSIVAWAYYPLGIAQTAVNVERERQAALMPNARLGPRCCAVCPCRLGVQADARVRRVRHGARRADLRRATPGGGAPALPKLGLAMKIIRIERDEEAIAALEDDLIKFLALVRENESKLRRAAMTANAGQMLEAA